MIDVFWNILFGKKKHQYQLLNFSYLIKKKIPQGIKIPNKLADEKYVTFYCKILTDLKYLLTLSSVSFLWKGTILKVKKSMLLKISWGINK